VLAVAGAAALGSSGWGATRTRLLEVKKVDVRGANHTAAADILKAAGLDHGAYMVEVDEKGTARRIDVLPWVDRARVRRRWPSTVVVSITERVPALAARAPGGWALVDPSGRVLARQAQRPPGPVLEGATVGPPGSRLDAEGAGAVAAARAVSANPALAPRVQAVTLRDGGDIWLRLRGAGAVRLGNADDLGEKLRSAATMLARAELGALAVLDVRAPANPVIIRQPNP
jgi:cell division protein FtsQ